MPEPAWSKLRVPYGLLITLGLYGALVLAYVAATYWTSPEYQAAVHAKQAADLLGLSEGRGASVEQLTSAYQHLLEAARLMPQVKGLHQQLEKLNWRFEERGVPVPAELRLRSEAVAALWQRIHQEEQPHRVVGARDRGWSAEQLLEGPGRTLRHSLVGVLLVLALWGYVHLKSKTSLNEGHEANRAQRVEDLNKRDR